MPYILPENRIKFEPILINLEIFNKSLNARKLMHLISSICILYLHHRKESYYIYNELIGVLECVKLEYIRRNRVFIIEDTGIYLENSENTDLFDDTLDYLNQEKLIENPGELNYLLSSICAIYTKLSKDIDKYTLIISMLNTIKKNLYYTIIGSYEDTKILKNGDIYE